MMYNTLALGDPRYVVSSTMRRLLVFQSESNQWVLTVIIGDSNIQRLVDEVMSYCSLKKIFCKMSNINNTIGHYFDQLGSHY